MFSGKSIDRVMTSKPRPSVTYKERCLLAIRLYVLLVLLLGVGLAPEYLPYQAAIARGHALKEATQYRAALDSYENAWSIRPQALTPRLEEAQINLELGRFGEALMLYRQIFDQEGARPDVLIDWGRAYYNLGDSERAIPLWEYAAQEEEPVAHFYLAEACMSQASWAEARRHFEEVLRLSARKPDDYTQKTNYWLGKLHSLDAASLSQALAYLDRAEQGADATLAFNARAVASVLRLSETSPDTLSTRLGATLFGLGHQELAQVQLEQAIQKNPDDVEALIYLGAITTQRGAFQEAESYLQKALLLAANHPLALYFWGKYQLQRGEISPARQSFARLLAIDSQNAAACVEIARTYLAESKYALAEQWLDAAIDNEPSQAEFYIILAEFETTTSFNLNKGLRAAIQATMTDPDNPIAFDLLGRLFYLSGQWTEAESALKEAVALAQREVSPYYHLGELYERQNRTSQARWAFGRAVDLGRDSPSIQRLAEQALQRLGPGPERPPWDESH